MDKKVKYYKAVNQLYGNLLCFKGSEYYSKFLHEFCASIDGMVEVLAYDPELTIQDKLKVLKYFNKLR